MKRTLVLMLLLSFSVPSFAQNAGEASTERATAVTLYIESGTDIPQPLRRIVGEALAIQLEFYDVPTEIRYLDPGVAAPSAGSAPSAGESRSQAGAAIVATVSGDSSTLTVEATYLSADGDAQATQSYQGPVDLRLDRSLARLIDGLVEAVPDLAAPAPQTAEDTGTGTDAGGNDQSDAGASAENQAAGGEVAGQGGIAGDGTPGGSAGSGTGEGTTPAGTGEDATVTTGDPAASVTPQVVSPSFSGGLRVGATFSTLVPIGDASRYFQTLYGPSAFIGWSFEDSLITIGLHGGASFTRAAGASVDTNSIIVPLGFDFRLAFGSYPLEAGLRVGAGVAMVSLDVPQLGSPTFFVPMVDGGLTTQLYLGEVVGITVDLAFSVYIESSITIMGFRPQIGIMLTL